MTRMLKAAALAALVAISACASKPKIVAQAPPPPPAPVVPVYVPPPVTPINRGLSQAATMWHVRSALNVAALACRGANEAMIIARYNAMLATHKATLAGALSTMTAEYKAGGGNWQDRQDDAMTKLYNFFSQAQARDAFCAAAAATLAETETLAPGEFQAFATAVLPTLDLPFAEMLAPRPVIAVASAASATAPVYMPAVAAPMPAPRAVVPTAAPAPVPVTVQTPAPAVATRAPMAAVGTRAMATPAAAPAKPAPRLEVDLSVLQQ